MKCEEFKNSDEELSYNASDGDYERKRKEKKVQLLQEVDHSRMMHAQEESKPVEVDFNLMHNLLNS